MTYDEHLRQELKEIPAFAAIVDGLPSPARVAVRIAPAGRREAVDLGLAYLA